MVLCLWGNACGYHLSCLWWEGLGGGGGVGRTLVDAHFTCKGRLRPSTRGKFSFSLVVTRAGK